MAPAVIEKKRYTYEDYLKTPSTRPCDRDNLRDHCPLESPYFKDLKIMLNRIF